MPTLNKTTTRLPWERQKGEAIKRETDAFLNTAAWRKMAAIKRQGSPLCEYCEAVQRIRPAEHVDHAIARGEHGGAPLDFDNLLSACIPCHAKKTRMEARGPLCATMPSGGYLIPASKKELIQKVNDTL